MSPHPRPTPTLTPLSPHSHPTSHPHTLTHAVSVSHPQTFSGILLLIGAAVNYFYETYYCEPKLRVLFDKLRPHLQV